MKKNNQTLDVKSSLLRLYKYINQYHVALIIILLMSIVSTLFSVAGPKILALVTDELVLGVRHKLQFGVFQVNFNYIIKIILLMLALYVISAIISLLQNFIMSKITANIIYKLRADVMEKIEKLPVSYFNKNSYGDVLSRMSNDIDTIYTSISSGLIALITSLVTIVGILIMMLSINIIMTVVTVLILPVLAYVVSLIVKKSQKYFVEQRTIIGDLNGKIEEDFSAIYLIKAFNEEEQSLEGFKVDNEKLYRVNLKAQFLSQLIMPASVVVTNLGYVIVCIISVILAINGKLKIGSIQAFLQYQKNFTQPIGVLSSVSNEVQKTAAAANRVFELLDEPDVVEYKDSNDIADYSNAVVLDHVAFGYDDSKKLTINDLSLSAKKGEKIAIVGSTGAGKTTIVKLLMGYYQLNKGKIYINGVDSTHMSRESLRNHFAFVLQDTWLFSGTIMENIRYGRLGASDEDVYKVAKLSKAHHFIKSLPDGYNTMINEDSDNISQGQKQLLTIARAMLKEAEILILDEATSSVDTKTEKDIQVAMDKLMENKTSFVIAHRLSTIKNANLILVLEKGDVIEMGSHDYLMEQKGRYYQMNQA